MREPSPIDPDVFLAHEGRIRALARDLVGNVDLGEDVAQQTWVAALEHPPEESRALRSWLARVARNIAHRTLRREQWRRGWERTAAVGEAVPSADEVAGRLALQRSMTELVERLPEARRLVVYLRYYEDPPPREIAHRLDAPVETVSTRLKRALQCLRELAA